MSNGSPRRRRHRRGGRICRERVDSTLTLLDCWPGDLVTVTRIAPWVTCAARLRELGILEGSQVVVLRTSDPLLLLAKDTRIAVDLGTAAGVEVAGEVMPR